MNRLRPLATVATALPRHIYRHPDGGLIVLVRRAGVRFQAWIPAGDPERQLDQAIRRRDHFLQLAGEPARPVHSNTGIRGISETTMWTHSNAYPCFNVSWSRDDHRTMRRVVYGSNGLSRDQALAQAIALRSRMTEQSFSPSKS